jgi:hypothetical protein
MPDRVTKPIVDGSPSTSSRVRLFPPNTCCICFETLAINELEPVSDAPGRVWDVCKPCADMEKAAGAEF